MTDNVLTREHIAELKKWLYDPTPPNMTCLYCGHKFEEGHQYDPGAHFPECPVISLVEALIKEIREAE